MSTTSAPDRSPADRQPASPHDAQEALRRFTPSHEFFVGIDSDGCAFNSMEVKHNDSFSVNFIKHFGLQAVSRQAHQAWDFVNLYSQTRGCNRFKALVSVSDLMRDMPRVRKSGVGVPELPHLRAWCKAESQLGNPKLKAKIAAASGEERAELERVLAWSHDVNKTIEEIVHDLPPFPGVRESLEKLRPRADIMVVSATPQEALDREWAEHGIDRYVALIAGQEAGSKTEHLTLAAKGKYAADAVLMVGDAPGDLKAARDVGALFFPINPGYEEESWERFLKEGIERFFARSYAGAYERQLIAEFDKLLPKDPPWTQARKETST
jgi:phosphoglycolate phosphatase-like HAD superfamily hydrolase